MKRRPGGLRACVALALLPVLAGAAVAAEEGVTESRPPSGGVDWNVRLDPGVAGFLSSTQSRLFGVGGGASARAAISPLPFLDLHLALGLLAFAPKDTAPGDGAGLAWLAGAGFRVKRPWTAGFVSPWLDLDVTYVRTGPLDRLGFSVGAGAAFAVNARRTVRIGPFLRYSQIVTPSNDKLDATDAKIFIGGVSVEYGRAIPAKREVTK